MVYVYFWIIGASKKNGSMDVDAMSQEVFMAHFVYSSQCPTQSGVGGAKARTTGKLVVVWCLRIFIPKCDIQSDLYQATYLNWYQMWCIFLAGYPRLAMPIKMHSTWVPMWHSSWHVVTSANQEEWQRLCVDAAERTRRGELHFTHLRSLMAVMMTFQPIIYCYAWAWKELRWALEIHPQTWSRSARFWTPRLVPDLCFWDETESGSRRFFQQKVHVGPLNLEKYDGCEIQQLIGSLSHHLEGSTIQGDAGFLPSYLWNSPQFYFEIRAEFAKDGWTQISQAIRREVEKIQGLTVGKDLLWEFNIIWRTVANRCVLSRTFCHFLC